MFVQHNHYLEDNYNDTDWWEEEEDSEDWSDSEEDGEQGCKMKSRILVRKIQKEEAREMSNDPAAITVPGHDC